MFVEMMGVGRLPYVLRMFVVEGMLESTNCCRSAGVDFERSEALPEADRLEKICVGDVAAHGIWARRLVDGFAWSARLALTSHSSLQRTIHCRSYDSPPWQSHR